MMNERYRMRNSKIAMQVRMDARHKGHRDSQNSGVGMETDKEERKDESSDIGKPFLFK